VSRLSTENTLLSVSHTDLTKERSKPGLPRRNAFPPYINSDPPLIDSAEIPRSFCSGKHTHSAAYTEEYAAECVCFPLQNDLGISAESISGGSLLMYGGKALRRGRPGLLRSLVRSV